MNKKKVITIILLIVLIIIAIFLGCTIRKMIIIKDLSQKVSEYENSKNYYVKIVNSSGTTTEYYCKDDNAVLFLRTISNTGEKRNLTNYFKGEKTNTYIESGEEKIAMPNSNGLPSKITIIGLGDTNNLWQLFTVSVATSIKKGESDGKNCYILSLGKENEEYREIETGLRIKAKEGTRTDENGNVTDIIMEYHYEFNNVNDNIFTEPDISQYKIQEKN